MEKITIDDNYMVAKDEEPQIVTVDPNQAAATISKQVSDLVSEHVVEKLTSQLVSQLTKHINDSIVTPGTRTLKYNVEIETLMNQLYKANENLSLHMEKMKLCPHDQARIVKLTSCMYEILEINHCVYELLRLTYEN